MSEEVPRYNRYIPTINHSDIVEVEKDIENHSEKIMVELTINELNALSIALSSLTKKLEEALINKKASDRARIRT